jgi:hypothetical protein
MSLLQASEEGSDLPICFLPRSTLEYEIDTEGIAMEALRASPKRASVYRFHILFSSIVQPISQQVLYRRLNARPLHGVTPL